MKSDKIVIYSVLTRLWGNKSKHPRPSGTLAENGSGKFSSFTKEALAYIRSLGTTHVWYIGVLEHATKTNYSSIGIQPDHPDTVKGEAGSPYAVKDYYDIDPDLAEDPVRRQEEFDALLRRTHEAGLKVLMDFVPNHVARCYHSDAKPEGTEDLGEGDDKLQSFSPSNNFYYLPDSSLILPHHSPDTLLYVEAPARATGNDCFTSTPSVNDWYETVKLNYGIDYLHGGTAYTDPIPDTWLKMRDILRYWAARGVDGFRCDMAELVPESFWSWCITSLREEGYDLLFLAEVYQPHRYEAYLEAGFDYLYDKVGVYDRLIQIGQGKVSATPEFTWVRDAVGASQGKMCYFMENHDEQRLASPFALGNAIRGAVLSAVGALSGTNPFLLYFAQELGEEGMAQEGFSGCDGRTSIFDYWSLEKLQRLEEGGYSTKCLTPHEQTLLSLYRTIGELCHLPVIQHGGYFGLIPEAEGRADQVLSYVRYWGKELFLLVANLADDVREVALPFPESFFSTSGLSVGEDVYKAVDKLTGQELVVSLTPWAPLRLEVPSDGLRLLHLVPLD